MTEILPAPPTALNSSLFDIDDAEDGKEKETNPLRTLAHVVRSFYSSRPKIAEKQPGEVPHCVQGAMSVLCFIPPTLGSGNHGQANPYCCCEFMRQHPERYESKFPDSISQNHIAIANFMDENPERFQSKNPEFISFEEYCDAMTSDNTWGTELELSAFVDMIWEKFDRKYSLTFFFSKGNKDIQKRKFISGTECPPRYHLRICYVYENNIPYFDSVVPMSSIEDARQCTFQRDYTVLRKKLAKLVENHSAFSGLVDSMNANLEDLQEQYRQIDAPFSVALVGKMGDGKSLVVNSVVGANILQTGSAGEAVTRFVTKVSYSETYNVRVEYISRDDWEKEKRELISVYRDGTSRTEEKASALKTLSQVLNVKDSLLRELILKGKNIDLDDIAPGSKAEEKMALQVEQTSKISSCSRLETTLAQVWRKLNNYSAVVKQVEISGPFQSLSSGVSLVDLPGLGDADTHRNKLAIEERQKCQGCWIVMRSDRCKSEKNVHHLLSENQMRNKRLHGTFRSVALILTRSDQFHSHEEEQQFEIDGFKDYELLAVRKEHFTQSMKEHTLAYLDGDEDSCDAKCDVNIYTTSAIESLRVQGIIPKENTRFQVNSDFLHELTDIPRLKRSILRSIDQREKRKRLLNEQLLLQVEHLRRREASAENHSSIDLAASLEQVVTDAKISLDNSWSSMHGHRSVTSLERYSDEIKSSGLDTINGWYGEMHHFTFIAAVRNRGVHYSNARTARSGPINMNGERAESHSQFGEREARNAFQSLENSARSILNSLQSQLHEALQSATDVTQEIIRTRTNTAKQNISSNIAQMRRSHFNVESVVASHMRPGFDTASSYSGSGVTHAMYSQLRQTFENQHHSIMRSVCNMIRDDFNAIYDALKISLVNEINALQSALQHELDTVSQVDSFANNEELLAEMDELTREFYASVNHTHHMDRIHKKMLEYGSEDINAPENAELEIPEECAICYDCTANAILPCSHMFCQQCVLKVTSHAYNLPRCPYCRATFEEYEILPSA